MLTRPLFHFSNSRLTFHRTRLTKITFFSAAVSAAEGVVFFAADFFVVGHPGLPVCLVDCPVVFVELFVVAAVVDFAAFFFYPFFQGCANLYVPLHLQIQVPPPAALMK